MAIFDRKFLKFLLVGCINTLVGMTVMFSLYNLAGFGYWLSSACNYVAGGIVSFFLNKYFTFQQKDHDIGYLWRFILNTVICYLIAYSIAKPAAMAVLSGHMSLKLVENIAMLAGMGIYTVLGYFGQRFFVFK